MEMVIAAAGVAWSAVGIESLVETILTPGSAIRVFGRSIAFTGPRAEIIVMTLVGTSVGALVAVTATYIIQTIRSASLRDELERRNEQRALSDVALAAKNDLLSWRVDDLQRQADALLARRDDLLVDLSDVADRTTDLRTKAQRSKETLARLSPELAVAPALEALEGGA
jgi:gas vesicle protein